MKKLCKNCCGVFTIPQIFNKRLIKAKKNEDGEIGGEETVFVDEKKKRQKKNRNLWIFFQIKTKQKKKKKTES